MSLVLYANNERSTNSSIVNDEQTRGIAQCETFFSLSSQLFAAPTSAAAFSLVATLDTFEVGLSTTIAQLTADLLTEPPRSIALESIQNFYKTLTAEVPTEFLFYRQKDITRDPYNVVLRFADSVTTTTSNNYLSSLYKAEYSIDNNLSQPMAGMAPVTITLDTNPNNPSPTIHTINVRVSGLDRTKVPEQIFTFDYGLCALSSSAFFFEDWATDDVYAFYWALTTFQVSILPLDPVTAVDLDLLNAPQTVISIAGDYVYEGAPVSQEVKNLLEAVEGISGKRLNIFELPRTAEISSSQEMMFSVYKRLQRYTHLQLASSGTSLKIKQQKLQDPAATVIYPVSVYGGVDYAFTIPPLSGDVENFSVTAVFLSTFPVIDFIAYPTLVLSGSHPSVTAVNVDANNFQDLCRDLSFYGEGHEQQFILSASVSNVDPLSSAGIHWCIGSKSVPSMDKTTTSPFNVITNPNNNLAAVAYISSVPAEESVHSIAVLCTFDNSYITRGSPIITYPDTSGTERIIPQYYPFYYCTKILGENNVNNTTFKNNIVVLPYPDPTTSIATTPFPSEQIKLPYDKTAKSFTSSIASNNQFNTVANETDIGTQWSISGKTENDISWKNTTARLQTNIQKYIFELAYDEEQSTIYLPVFKCSKYADTTITVDISSYKKLIITPVNVTGDWKERQLVQRFQFATKILSQPLDLKLYTPNYYQLTNEEVAFTVYYEQHNNLVLSAIDLFCDNAVSGVRFNTVKVPTEKDSYLLKTETLSVVFDKVGLADIKLVAYLFDSTDSNLTIIPYEKVFENIVEVVEEFDDIKPSSYYTFLNPPNFTEKEAPILSPNEWLIHNNVNDSLVRLYKTFEEVNDLTYLYKDQSKFYSWIAFQQTPSDVLLQFRKYTWEDLECKTDIDLEDQTVWFNFECANQNDPNQTKNITWQEHFCLYTKDFSCKQKYCLEWNWKKRKSKNSNVKVSWKTAKKNNVYEKLWRYEGCDSDSSTVNCNKIRWNCAAFDKKAFPIPYSISESRCSFSDVDYVESLDMFVVAHQKEIRLFKNTLESNYVSRKGSSDEFFSFQDIVGLAVNSQGRIFVLDRILPKVSVFQFLDNQIAVYDSWGNYGLQDNPLGFNKPSDIHIDQDDFVWIADTGNKCIKKFTGSGKAVFTLQHEILEANPPSSLCVDSEYKLHVLSDKSIFVFDATGKFIFKYTIDSEVEGITKINTNYSREIIYISYNRGVVKYFKNGKQFGFLIKDYLCRDGQILEGFTNIFQDKFANVFAITSNKILKFGDLMKTIELKGKIPDYKYWTLDQILVDKEEYVQPWVYLRGFHRLWDNIESVRSALFYNINKCKIYIPPTHKKEDLVIGQNEIVTNTVLNRLIKQLWDNLETLKKYFDAECEKKLN